MCFIFRPVPLDALFSFIFPSCPSSFASGFDPSCQYFHSHFMFSSQVEQCGDRMCISLARDMTSLSCVPATSMAVHQEAPQTSGISPGVPTTSISTKSAQRAYLQSLDRSSRAWVLSSGKTQVSDEACRLQEESGNNIWYNPIPEEEDAGGPHREEDIWRRRDEREEGGATKRAGPGDTRAELGDLQEGANPSVSHLIDDITTENTGETTSGLHLILLHTRFFKVLSVCVSLP